jgi:membrane-associated phospholipid phosphatase
MRPTRTARLGPRGALAALIPRLRRELAAKVVVLLGLTVGICVPYFTLQRVAWLPLRQAPTTPLDRWIAFDPAWIYAYLSIALLVPLAPLLATRRDELVRYARGLAWLCGGCFAAFLLFPVAGPRPSSPPGGAYALLVSWDRASNSLPSLHAGLVVYSLLFLDRTLRGDAPTRLRRACAVAGWTWAALILYATLATKQHWAVDLPAGALAAAAAHAVAWRTAGDARPEPAPGRRPARGPEPQPQAADASEPRRDTHASAASPTSVARIDRYCPGVQPK